MHRSALLELLARYEPSSEEDAAARDRIVRFVEGHEECFERSLELGHVTGSAWIVDPTRTRCLLTHHRKLGRWLQLGGHADGDPDVPRVALREAQEESGLSSVRPVSGEIFDCDVHPIPARGAEPQHDHYDVRFLFEADPDEPLVVSDESHELAWVALANLGERSTETSILRMAAKSFRRERD
jgi:8-oxo-dGTP pyrophosphatase MutT (NUDIX family)